MAMKRCPDCGEKYSDTYKAAAPIYYVGVTPRETPIPDTPSID